MAEENMRNKDKQKIIDRYEARLAKLGPVPQALGWLKGRQVFRFHFLKEIVGFNENDSVLDLGCAFGDLEPYLRSVGWKGRYCGIDIVPGLIEQGKKKYPHLDLRVLDIQNDELPGCFDWVFSSAGLFNQMEEIDSYAHLKDMLTTMLGMCRKGISTNFCSPYVDFESEINLHPDMGRLCSIFASITKRFSIRHDYMPYEFTVYCYKDVEIYEKANVFFAYEPLYQVLKTEP